MPDNENHIILFDGLCNLCNSVVQFTIKQDIKGKFKFASLQSEAGQALLRKMHLPVKDFDSFVYIEGEKAFFKSSAALNVLKVLGGGWGLLYYFILVPKPIRDFAYKLVSKTRYSIFGKRAVCMVPDATITARFLKN